MTGLGVPPLLSKHVGLLTCRMHAATARQSRALWCFALACSKSSSEGALRLHSVGAPRSCRGPGCRS
jgi:hypothetical protein